jgi:site-specific DNA-methyltransferase (adenine-specific)
MTQPERLTDAVTLFQADCLHVLRSLPTGSVSAVITDPPYALNFMGKTWDNQLPGVETWAETLRVLQPGGYACIFGGSRTYHRLACNVEDAGFEMRDCIMWLYGSGFPKGTGCLKPSYEPILLARKSGSKVLPLGIDDCRVGTDLVPTRAKRPAESMAGTAPPDSTGSHKWRGCEESWRTGRYPANVVHDGSPEVLGAFAAFGERRTHATGARGVKRRGRANAYGEFAGIDSARVYGSDSGTAARFYFCAKASRSERGDSNTHPTVKPLALARWLARLICQPGGTVLDPFAGSGTTALAALAEGRKCVLVEKEPAYCDIIRKRVAKSAGLFAGASA